MTSSCASRTSSCFQRQRDGLALELLLGDSGQGQLVFSCGGVGSAPSPRPAGATSFCEALALRRGARRRLVALICADAMFASAVSVAVCRSRLAMSASPSFGRLDWACANSDVGLLQGDVLEVVDPPAINQIALFHVIADGEWQLGDGAAWQALDRTSELEGPARCWRRSASGRARGERGKRLRGSAISGLACRWCSMNRPTAPRRRRSPRPR